MSSRGNKDVSSVFSSLALREACRRLPEPGHRSRVIELDNPRHASVLVPLLERDDGLEAVITQRTASLRHHGEEWVFPGGRVDPGDASLAAAAVREASEELGVAEADIELLGQLDSRGPILTGYVVHVFVALVYPRAPWQPDATEVAEVVTVPLSRLTAPDNVFHAPIPSSHDPGPLPGNRVMPSPSLPMLHFTVRSGEYLWGMQAEILVELIGHLDADLAADLGGCDGT